MEAWYRKFLLMVSFSTFLFIPVELALSGHTDGLLQWIPFGISGLAVISLITWHFKPSRWTLRAVRTVMLASCIACIWGSIEHFKHNLEFELEIRPNAGWTDVIVETISGASPLLAPGILFLAGILALAALYKVPVPKRP